MPSHLLHTALKSIPSHRERGEPLVELVRRMAQQAAIGLDAADAALGVALDLMRLLDLLHEADGHINLGGQMQTYCRNSLLWYLEQERQLLSNWSRPGTAHETVSVANLLEQAPYFLKALEERRYAIAQQARLPMVATREQPCSVVLIKAVLLGQTYLLHQWDQQAERYQLIGGKQRQGETPEQTATREVLEELPLAQLVVGNSLIVKPSPINAFDEWKVSPTFGALTHYDLHVFQATIKKPDLLTSETDLWISLPEVLECRTHAGAPVAPLGSMIARRDSGFLENLPASLALKDLRRVSQAAAPAGTVSGVEFAARPKLFISHRHRDEEIVSALVDVLRAAFVVAQSDIRCTSVRPYRLPVGERTPDRLRRELRSAEAVIGVITPDTAASSYVLFELGGAWAQNILTCTMLARGASIADIPDPIRDINPLSLEDERDCQQFLDDLEDRTTLKRQARVGGDVAERIRKLVDAARRT